MHNRVAAAALAALFVTGEPRGSGDDADWFGAAAVSVPDLDGDGLRELIVGSPGFYPEGSGEGFGGAFLMSSKTGSVLRAYAGPPKSGWVGMLVVGGQDCTGDGRPNVVIAGSDSVSLLDTSLKTRVWERHEPDRPRVHLIEVVPDVDGDGFCDVAVLRKFGERDTFGRPYLLSGSSGELIAELKTEPLERWGGVCLKSYDPVEGVDGAVLILSHEHSICLYSVEQGVALRNFSRPSNCIDFPRTAEVIWDVDGLGMRDVAFSALERVGQSKQGVVYLLSAETGEVLRELRSPPDDTSWGYALFGHRIRYVKKIGKGAGPGLLISDPGMFGGVHLVDSQGKTVMEWKASLNRPRFGESLEVIQAPDGDGVPEIAIGTANYYGPPEYGSVDIFALDSDVPRDVPKDVPKRTFRLPDRGEGPGSGK